MLNGNNRGRKPIAKEIINTTKAKALVGHKYRVYARGSNLIIEIPYGNTATPDEIKETPTYQALKAPSMGRGRPRLTE